MIETMLPSAIASEEDALAASRSGLPPWDLRPLAIGEDTALVLLHLPEGEKMPEAISEASCEGVRRAIRAGSGRNLPLLIVPHGFSLDTLNTAMMARLGWVRREPEDTPASPLGFGPYRGPAQPDAPGNEGVL